MDTREEEARRLERLAAEEVSLARSQALDAEASRLREGTAGPRSMFAPLLAMPIFRN